MPAVLLDSNLLVLLIVGSTNRSYVAKHRRLQAYDESDFDLLVQVIAPMSAIIVTPNILTETSNLVSQIAEPARAHIAQEFRRFINIAEERYIESKHAVQRSEFPHLWLTDSSILTELPNAHVLVTADLDLYLAASRQGYTAVNFNHLRPQ